MNCKEDWGEAQERFKAWWDCEITDRVACQVWAPRKGTPPSEWEFDYLAFRTCLGFARAPHDPEATIRLFERKCSGTFYGGEAFPLIWANIGPGMVGGYLGAPSKVVDGTVWWGAQWNHASAKSLDEVLELEFSLENDWWQHTRRIIKTCLEHARGRYIVGYPDLVGIYDNLSTLMMSQQIIVEMFRRPNDVKKAAEGMKDVWLKCYEDLYRLIQEKQKGSSCTGAFWHPTKCYCVLDDFAYLLSPRYYREFVLPPLRNICRNIDGTICHHHFFEEPRLWPYVDDLLNMPELRGIESYCSPDWLHLYRRAQKNGKLLLFTIGGDGERSREQIRYLLRNLSPKGILIRTRASSEECARQLLEELKALS